MTTLDTFVRGGSETSPYKLSNHTGNNSLTYTNTNSNDIAVLATNYVYGNATNTVGIYRTSFTEASANYESALTFTYVSNASDGILRYIGIVHRYDGTNGYLGRIVSYNGTIYLHLIKLVNNTDPANNYVTISAGVLVTGHQYKLIVRSNGSNHYATIQDVTSSKYIDNTLTFNSTNETFPISISDSSYTAQTIGIYFLDNGDSNALKVQQLDSGPIPVIPPATSISISAPTSSGTVGLASGNFTLSIVGSLASDLTITLAEQSSDGTFSPSSITIPATQNATSSATFTYASNNAGTKTIVITNNGGLTNPSNTSYSVLQKTIVVCEGNSLTFGYGATASAYPVQLSPIIGTGFNIINRGVNSQTTTQMLANQASEIANYYTSATKVVCIAWEITNDLYFGATPQQAYTNYKNYCLGWKNAGAYVIVVTVLPRTGGEPASQETSRQTINAQMRIDYPQYSHALVDLASDARVGPSGSQTNTTYYQGDTTHLNATGYAIPAQMAATAIFQTLSGASIGSGSTTSFGTFADIAI